LVSDHDDDAQAGGLGRTSSPFGVQDASDDDLGAAAAAAGHTSPSQGATSAAAAAGLSTPQGSTSVPSKLQPVVSLDADSAPAPNRAATEPARLAGPSRLSKVSDGNQPGTAGPSSIEFSPLDVQQQQQQGTSLSSNAAPTGAAVGPAGSVSASLAAAGSHAGAGRIGQPGAAAPVGVAAVSTELEPCSAEPSPGTVFTISSTGAEAGWMARAGSVSPAADADVSEEMSVGAGVGGKAGVTGGKSGSKGGKRSQKGWGRLFTCCAAPGVKE
jgi:hypothetical protein